MEKQILVITPAGQIKVDTVEAAAEYYRLYQYPYVIREVLDPAKSRVSDFSKNVH